MKTYDSYEEAKANKGNKPIWKHDAGYYAVASYEEMAEHCDGSGEADSWTEISPDDTITLAEAADLYPLAYATLAQAAREGRIEARQSGKAWLTTRAAIEEAIEAGRLKPRR